MRQVTLLVFAGVMAAAAMSSPPAAFPTPVYSARDGRDCDACHLSPADWTDAAHLSSKRSMSCQACHVDPAGGGMRNAVGRFYGGAALAMRASRPQPAPDWRRAAGDGAAGGKSAAAPDDGLPESPPDLAASHEARFAPHDLWAHGRPIGGSSRYALFQGREGVLNSDPMLRASWDARAAALVSQGTLFFPMQADVAIALHPVEHVTLLANVGARGRTAGISQTLKDARTPYLREGFLMLHEAPGQAYLKAGRFVPSFGSRLDDHTAQNRREFEQDGSVPEARVTGIEAGANPGKLLASGSWFRSTARPRVPSAFDLFDTDCTRGMTVNLGYRDAGWSAGASALAHRRPVGEGGDATSFALYGSLAPRSYRGAPLVYQAEYDRGRYRRESGRQTGRAGFYQELDWQARRGINLLLAQDWADPDTEVKDDHAFRVSAGVQLTPVPGVTLDLRVRSLFPASGQSGADLFTQLHLWR